MTRRKRRVHGRTGIWQDTPATRFVPADQLPDGDTPYTRRCPHCHAAPRQPCTRPSRRRGGRTELRGYHDSRCVTPSDQEES